MPQKKGGGGLEGEELLINTAAGITLGRNLGTSHLYFLLGNMLSNTSPRL